MLGIIGAMDEGVAMTKAQLTDVQMESRAVMDLYKGKPEGKEVVVIRSSIGKVNAATCIQILADIYDATGMMNTGITSSLKAEINIGDTVLSSDALQHDMDATEFGYESGQTPRVEMLASKADEGLMDLAGERCSRVNPDIHTPVGRVVTGDQFISDKEKKKWLTDILGGYCIEMEGAAIARACYPNSIPFFIVRAISDKAGDSASVGHPASEAKAIVRSVNLLTETVRSLRQEKR